VLISVVSSGNAGRVFPALCSDVFCFVVVVLPVALYCATVVWLLWTRRGGYFFLSMPVVYFSDCAPTATSHCCGLAAQTPLFSRFRSSSSGNKRCVLLSGGRVNIAGKYFVFFTFFAMSF
jgi:hypothetical protein